jgi:3-dehydroquinate synthase
VLIRPGERSKTIGTARRLWRFFLDAGLRRDGCVFALGGGVVGDVAGFTAATYMRGVPLLQVPTSLLAQVDASIGGKTGVNLPAAKNIVGAFHQPVAVVCSVDVLRTLPERHYRSGLAEVVKTAAVGDAELFEFLEQRTGSLMRRDLDTLEDVVIRCARIKGEVVAGDERDTDGRAILNFGHTLGHALEEAAGFRRWTHGSAVAVGMAWAAEFSVDQGICRPEDAGRLRRLLSSLGLPASLPGISAAPLLSLMQIDKKARSGGLRLVVMESVGVCRVTGPVPEALLRSSLERFCDREVSA